MADPEDQFMAVRGGLCAATTVWDLAVGLLDAWEASRPADPAWSQGHGARYDAWADVHQAVYRIAREWSNASLADTAADLVLAAVKARWMTIGVDGFHAAAYAVDEAAHALFAGTWCSPDQLVELQPGQPFYVAEPRPLDVAESALSQTDRPTASSEPELGELPHVRRYGGGERQVVIDPRWQVALRAVARGPRPLAAAHPNGNMSEFAMKNAGRATYPVTVKRDGTPDEQSNRFAALIEQACSTGINARIIVFPELTSSPEIADLVAQKIDRVPGRRLVVAGSWHEIRGGDGVNVATALMSRVAERFEHEKMVTFLDENKTPEGIRRSTRLVLYDAGSFRFGIAICKDLLDENVRNLYSRHGVNILLVPAMSTKMDGFSGAAEALVNSRQAVTLVANAALTDHGGPIQPTSLLGQPFRGARVVKATQGGPAPALTLFRVGADRPIR